MITSVLSGFYKLRYVFLISFYHFANVFVRVL